MPTFGENLRREREMRGVTLEEIAETTKISTRFLKAMEEDDFSELPGGVFTRSFIRSYAQYLGLDEEHVLSEYKRVAQPASDNDLGRFAAPKPLAPKSGARARILPWVVAAAAFSAGYAVYRHSHRTLELPSGSVPASAFSTTPASPPSGLAVTPAASGPSAPAASNASSAGANPGSPSIGASSGNAAETPNDRQGSADQPLSSASGSAAAQPLLQQPATPAIGEGDLVLQVATTEDAWLAVQADGKTVLQRVLPPNSVQTFRAKDSFDVTTGNAQGTILTLNGETQKPLGRHGEFRKIHLARSDFAKQAP